MINRLTILKGNTSKNMAFLLLIWWYMHSWFMSSKSMKDSFIDKVKFIISTYTGECMQPGMSFISGKVKDLPSGIVIQLFTIDKDKLINFLLFSYKLINFHPNHTDSVVRIGKHPTTCK